MLAAFSLAVLPPAAAEPDDSLLVEEAGYEALEAGREEQAERLFLRALHLDSKSAASLAGLGFVRMRAWEFREAEARFAAALEVAPGDPVVSKALVDARYWAALKEGDAARSQGLHEKAQSRYREALTVKPGDASATERLAELELAAPVQDVDDPASEEETAEVAQAEVAPAEPVELEPVSDETSPVKAEGQAVSRPVVSPAAAVAAAERRLKEGNLLSAQDVLVQRAGSQQEWATIRNVVRKGRTEPLSKVELQTLLAAAYFGLEDVPSGIRVARAAEEDLRLSGRNAPSYLQVQTARLLLARNPLDHELHSRLSYSSQLAGLPAPAVDDLRELWIRWSVGWARKALDGGNPERAITVLERARGSYPREPRIQNALADARQNLERPKPRRRWNSNPGMIVIHGLRERPVVVAQNEDPPRSSRRLSGGITIAGA